MLIIKYPKISQSSKVLLFYIVSVMYFISVTVSFPTTAYFPYQSLSLYHCGNSLHTKGCIFTLSPIPNIPRKSFHYNTSNDIIQLYSSSSENNDQDKEISDLREEIDTMRNEALKRLNALSNRISETDNDPTIIGKQTNVVEDILYNQSVITLENNSSDDPSVKNFENNGTIESTTSSEQSSSTTTTARRLVKTPIIDTQRSMLRDELALLDNTKWKLSLNIGREPGTWMPKTWAVKGERLILNLEVTFTDLQLYEPDDFLGSMGGSKILNVKNSVLTLSPSLTEGVRTVPVKNGGWRVVKGAGPVGTDLLRFYIEVDQDISHTRSDVYCPSGRVYCSLGFYSMARLSASSMKDRLRKQLDKMVTTAETLSNEIRNDNNIFSIDKIQKQTELFKLRKEMEKVGEQYAAAAVTEPNYTILKFSPKKDVGLTKEGGICCKVSKAFVLEYHILGRVNISPIMDDS